MVGSAPLWSVVLVPVILAGFAFAAAVADGALVARAGGGRLTGAVATAPLAEVARLLAGQRRTTPAADRLLWRSGVLAVPVAAVLAAVVIPFGSVTVSRMSVGVVWFNAMEADRKSTRLNSSHLGISYAVFCLKKKKKNKIKHSR